MAIRVFVYGTLKKGEPNYFRLLDKANGVARFLGKAKLSEKYPLVLGTSCNLPMLLADPGNGKEVFGEVYEVDDKMLQHLDWLENHPKTYKRSPCQCIMLGSDASKPQPEELQQPGEQTVLDSEVYLIFGFKPNFLALPHISSYTNSTDSDRKYKGKDERKDCNVMDEIKK